MKDLPGPARPTVGKRVCVICGGTPLTNEHVIPQWLAEPLGAKDQEVTHAYESPPSMGAPRREWATTGVDLKVKRVCAECNNGWMNDLERGVQPFLGNLVRGRIAMLGPSRRAVLVRWLLKTIAMQQLAEPTDAQIVPSDLAHEARDCNPPSNRFQVWAAGNDFEAGVALGVRGFEAQAGDGPQHSSWIHACVLRRVTLVTLDLGAEGNIRPVVVQGPLTGAIAQLWPASGSVTVPARKRLSKDQVPLILHMLAYSAT